MKYCVLAKRFIDRDKAKAATAVLNYIADNDPSFEARINAEIAFVWEKILLGDLCAWRYRLIRALKHRQQKAKEKGQ